MFGIDELSWLVPQHISNLPSSIRTVERSQRPGLMLSSRVDESIHSPPIQFLA
jgi:hypothetical protein